MLTLVLVPVSAIQAALAQTQRIMSRPKTFAGLSLLDLGAQLGLAVLLVLLGFGPSGLVLGFIGGSIIGLLAAGVASASVLRARPDRATASAIASEGVRFLPYTIAFIVADWIVRTTLANAMGAVAVASFGVALRLTSVLSLVGAAFSMAWGPVGLARERGPQTSRLFGRALLAYGVASAGTALVLAALGPEVIQIVAGNGFGDAALILPGLALAAAIAGTEYVLVVAAGIAERGSRVALASTVGALVQVGATLLAVPVIGLAAVGPAALLGRSVSFGILLLSVRRDVAVGRGLLLALAVGSVAAAVVLQVRVASAPETDPIRWLAALGIGLVAAILTLRAVAPDRSAP